VTEPRFRRRLDAPAAPLGDRLLVLDVARARFVGLNAVGARLWALLETPSSADDLVARLLAEFEVDAATCRIETAAVLRDLVARGLVEEDPDPCA